MKRTTKSLTLKLTRGALVAALYVALTYASFGFASGAIQLRVSECLCVLPLFMPEAIIGLTVGCALSNLLTGCVFWDILFGSLATLIGAALAYLLRGLPERLKWLATLPTILANAFIVPAVLIYAYGAPDSYFFLVFTVGIGEILGAGVLGSILYYSIKKGNFLF